MKNKKNNWIKWGAGIVGGVLVFSFLKPVLIIGAVGTGVWGLSKLWKKVTK